MTVRTRPPGRKPKRTDSVSVDGLFEFRRPVGACQADFMSAILTIQTPGQPAGVQRVAFGGARREDESAQAHRERLAMSLLKSLVADVGSKLHG